MSKIVNNIINIVWSGFFVCKSEKEYKRKKVWKQTGKKVFYKFKAINLFCIFPLYFVILCLQPLADFSDLSCMHALACTDMQIYQK